LKSKFYLDLVVEEIVPVELKSIAMLIAIHKQRLLSQLWLTNLPVGLLINFNVETLTAGGVKRVVNAKYRAKIPMTK
jgi:GxxExxY protein